MTVNIEHIGIDQDTEYAVEEVLNYAKESGEFDGNFTDAKAPNDADYLPGGNVVLFLDFIVRLAEDLIVKTKSPRKKWRLRSDIVKIMNLREQQASTHAATGKFLAFPSSPYAGLSDHLKIGFLLAKKAKKK